MNWFIASIASVGALALAELTQQHILNSKNEIDERVSGVLTFFFQSVLTLPIIYFLGLQGRFFELFHGSVTLNLFAVTLVGTAGTFFYLKSFRVENISYSSIFVSLSAIVSTTLGIIFFNEGVSLIKFIGIGLVLISVISLNISNGAIEKNHLYGLLAGTCFGIMYTLDKSIVTRTHPVLYIFWAFFLVSLLGFFLNAKNTIATVKTLKLNDFLPVFVSGFGYLIYNFCTFIAYNLGGEVGKIDAINNSQIFLIILVEFFIFKQKEGIKRKLITAVIAFTGVAILGYL